MLLAEWLIHSPRSALTCNNKAGDPEQTDGPRSSEIKKAVGGSYHPLCTLPANTPNHGAGWAFHSLENTGSKVQTLVRDLCLHSSLGSQPVSSLSSMIMLMTPRFHLQPDRS